jgi:putative transcriptional regulator
MTVLMPTCEQVTALLTDYEEGALGPLDWLGVKLHLALCPPCRVFLNTFEQTPALLRRACGEASPRPAERALTGALAALREGRLPRGPQHHPESAAWSALEPGSDSFLLLLLRLHLGHCEPCRSAWGEDKALRLGPEPVSLLRPHLPPEGQWRWVRHGLGGAQTAILQEDPTTGASLSLVRLPGGRQAPRHRHLGREWAILLQGGLQDGPAHLRAGDWIAHEPGSQHSPSADPDEECWALVALEKPVRFTGWRGLLQRLDSQGAPPLTR